MLEIGGAISVLFDTSRSSLDVRPIKYQRHNTASARTWSLEISHRPYGSLNYNVWSLDFVCGPVMGAFETWLGASGVLECDGKNLE